MGKTYQNNRKLYQRVKTLPEFYTILQSVHTTESVGNEQILVFENV